MHSNGNIKIIEIRPSGSRLTLGTLAALIQATISDCKAQGYTDIETCINEEDFSAEIHVRRDLEHHIQMLELPSIEISPIVPDTRRAAQQHRNESNLRKTYNRIQNTKYNMAARNYKGRRR